MTNSAEIAVITGCGVVASNGLGREAFAEALAEGRSGIGEIVSFDAADPGRERAAEIPDFDENAFLRSPKNYLDRNSALAFAACEMAVCESGCAFPDAQREYGLSVGSMGGNLETLAAFHARVQEKGPRLASPFLFPHTYCNATAGLLSIEYGLGGPHAQFCSGSAAGLEAVAFAAECVERGRTHMMLAGGVEAFNEWVFRMALDRGWISPTDGGDEECRPFGAKRNGSILGEGAAFFALESLREARERGARVLGAVAGFAVSSSASGAMRGALDRANIRPEDVDAVFASAGGYAREDAEEAEAVLEIFGEKRVPVVALKGLIGETLGASGTLNLAGAIVAIERGILPPSPESENCAVGDTTGSPEYSERISLCPRKGHCLDYRDRLDLVRNPRPAALRTVLVNASSPGAGQWISLVVSSAPDVSHPSSTETTPDCSRLPGRNAQ